MQAEQNAFYLEIEPENEQETDSSTEFIEENLIDIGDLTLETQREVKALIESIEETYKSQLASSFEELRSKIDNRHFYVMFEPKLNTDALSDHKIARSVLPILEPYVKDAEDNVEVALDASISNLIVSAFAHSYKAEIDIKYRLQKQIDNISIQLTKEQIDCDVELKLIDNLEEQLIEERSKFTKELEELTEEAFEKARVGGKYEPDFTSITNAPDDAAYLLPEINASDVLRSHSVKDTRLEASRMKILQQECTALEKELTDYDVFKQENISLKKRLQIAEDDIESERLIAEQKYEILEQQFSDTKERLKMANQAESDATLLLTQKLAEIDALNAKIADYYQVVQKYQLLSQEYSRTKQKLDKSMKEIDKTNSSMTEKSQLVEDDKMIIFEKDEEIAELQQLVEELKAKRKDADGDKSRNGSSLISEMSSASLLPKYGSKHKKTVEVDDFTEQIPENYTIDDEFIQNCSFDQSFERVEEKQLSPVSEEEKQEIIQNELLTRKQLNGYNWRKEKALDTIAVQMQSIEDFRESLRGSELKTIPEQNYVKNVLLLEYPELIKQEPDAVAGEPAERNDSKEQSGKPQDKARAQKHLLQDKLDELKKQAALPPKSTNWNKRSQEFETISKSMAFIPSLSNQSKTNINSENENIEEIMQQIEQYDNNEVREHAFSESTTPYAVKRAEQTQNDKWKRLAELNAMIKQEQQEEERSAVQDASQSASGMSDNEVLAEQELENNVSDVNNQQQQTQVAVNQRKVLKKQMLTEAAALAEELLLANDVNQLTKDQQNLLISEENLLKDGIVTQQPAQKQSLAEKDKKQAEQAKKQEADNKKNILNENELFAQNRHSSNNNINESGLQTSHLPDKSEKSNILLEQSSTKDDTRVEISINKGNSLAQPMENAPDVEIADESKEQLLGHPAGEQPLAPKTEHGESDAAHGPGTASEEEQELAGKRADASGGQNESPPERVSKATQGRDNSGDEDGDDALRDTDNNIDVESLKHDDIVSFEISPQNVINSHIPDRVNDELALQIKLVASEASSIEETVLDMEQEATDIDDDAIMQIIMQEEGKRAEFVVTKASSKGDLVGKNELPKVSSKQQLEAMLGGQVELEVQDDAQQQNKEKVIINAVKDQLFTKILCDSPKESSFLKDTQQDYDNLLKDQFTARKVLNNEDIGQEKVKVIEQHIFNPQTIKNIVDAVPDLQDTSKQVISTLYSKNVREQFESGEIQQDSKEILKQLFFNNNIVDITTSRPEEIKLLEHENFSPEQLEAAIVTDTLNNFDPKALAQDLQDCILQEKVEAINEKIEQKYQELINDESQHNIEDPQYEQKVERDICDILKNPKVLESALEQDLDKNSAKKLLFLLHQSTINKLEKQQLTEEEIQKVIQAIADPGIMKAIVQNKSKQSKIMTQLEGKSQGTDKYKALYNVRNAEQMFEGQIANELVQAIQKIFYSREITLAIEQSTFSAICEAKLSAILYNPEVMEEIKRFDGQSVKSMAETIYDPEVINLLLKFVMDETTKEQMLECSRLVSRPPKSEIVTQPFVLQTTGDEVQKSLKEDGERGQISSPIKLSQNIDKGYYKSLSPEKQSRITENVPIIIEKEKQAPSFIRSFELPRKQDAQQRVESHSQQQVSAVKNAEFERKAVKKNIACCIVGIASAPIKINNQEATFKKHDEVCNKDVGVSSRKSSPMREEQGAVDLERLKLLTKIPYEKKKEM